MKKYKLSEGNINEFWEGLGILALLKQFLKEIGKA